MLLGVLRNVCLGRILNSANPRWTVIRVYEFSCYLNMDLRLPPTCPWRFRSQYLTIDSIKNADPIFLFYYDHFSTSPQKSSFKTLFTFHVLEKERNAVSKNIIYTCNKMKSVHRRDSSFLLSTALGTPRYVSIIYVLGSICRHAFFPSPPPPITPFRVIGVSEESRISNN